jgi:phosphonoacetaldehyde hydrolase
MTRRLEAVIFDWAGTTVDHGSLAPVRALTELFKRHGIRVEDADVRRDMGLFKKDHIRRILQLPQVSIAWSTNKGRRPGEHDIEKLFAEFGPAQMEVLGQYSQVIAGAAETFEELQRRGLRVGSTTGYTRPMLDFLIQKAAAQGYRPEVSLCPDDVGGGRPHPWMCLQIVLRFQLRCVAAAVKVGDTVSDIEEGLNAGMWTVGISETGNEIGLSAAELAVLPGDERKRRSLKAAHNFQAAGGHYVIENLLALPRILEEIDQRLASGERPK